MNKDFFVIMVRKKNQFEFIFYELQTKTDFSMIASEAWGFLDNDILWLHPKDNFLIIMGTSVEKKNFAMFISIEKEAKLKGKQEVLLLNKVLLLD